MTQETVRKWLRGALSKSGKTQQEAAEGAGMARDALNKVLNGKRDLTATEMLALSTTLGVSVPGSKPYINSQGILPTAAPVRGIVAPGVWRETGAVMKQDYIVPVVPEVRYAIETQYALRYEGPGQNGFQYGDFLIFVPIVPNGSNVTDGDVVHLIRFNDRACETTIRSVRVLPDHTYELRGDPDKDQPIALADFKPQTDIEVRGVFIGQYRPKAS